MKIGFVGLGKLGLPIAQAIAGKGHEVRGYDIVPKNLPAEVASATIPELVRWADIIFAAPQTPHEPEYEGITPLPETRADFDYSYLKKCVADIAEVAKYSQITTHLVVISTCLPGTFDREIKPLLSDFVRYTYNPLFIAMGTEVADFLDPEFVLMGGDNTTLLEEFYASLHSKPVVATDIITAEGIKVSYNTWITAKTVIANVWGEIAYKTGMKFEDMHRAWSLATDRLISPRYMQAGMSDGGACHPRDNTALSWFAEQIDLSHDIFEDLMHARTAYEKWHAELAAELSLLAGLPLVILGRAFKPDTKLEAGSAALLLAHQLREIGYPFEQHEDLTDLPVATYFIATNHTRYADYQFPVGSVIINPSAKKIVRRV